MPTHDDEAGENPGATWLTPTVSLVAALVLYGLVVGIQLGTPPRSHSPAILVAVPAIIALAFGPPMIIGAAVLAVGTRWLFLIQEPGRLGSAIGTSSTILAIAVVSCFVVERRRRERSRLEKVTSVAETAQRALLRPPPPSAGALRIAASYRAAAQFARIGGDLYGVADSRYGVRALIGDVRGKGLGAVATTAVVLGSFHEAAYDRPTLDAVATQLDVSLRRHHADDEETFVTALLLEFGVEGQLRAVSCGHPGPVILRADEVLDLPVPAGLPLGLRGLLLDPEAEPEGDTGSEARLQDGDTVLMFTDGLTEARDASGAFYPMHRRLTACLRGSGPGAADPEALLAWVRRDVRAYSGGADHDDSALLALRYRPPATA